MAQFASAMSGDDVPQPGQRIEKLAAILIDQHRPVARDPDARLLLKTTIVQRMDQMGLIAAKIVGVGVSVHEDLRRQGKTGYSTGFLDEVLIKRGRRKARTRPNKGRERPTPLTPASPLSGLLDH